MGAVVVELDGVGKRYRLGEHHGSGMDLRDTLGALAGRMRRRARPERRELWSLRDVSLLVEEGQALGVIGRNGAGKSTLLKIVSNITTPTEGRCRTRGRVGSLLEVGTGFHGELTGVENTYLNGAILGMNRRAVTRRLDDIVSFAGLEGFMDTPVKRYSSGMYLRLGFAIAAHMEAEILLIDEILAVGDAEFQQRCLGKMSEVEQSGRTVLFVSHDLDAITRLCPTSVWLDGGRIRARGPTEEVVDAYTRGSGIQPTTTTVLPPPPGGTPAHVRRVALLDEHGQPTTALWSGRRGHIAVDMHVEDTYPALDVAVLVVDRRGVIVLDECLRDATPLPADHFRPGDYALRCPLPPVLAVGDYTVTLWLGSAYEEGERYEHALAFRVDGTDPKRRVIKLGHPWEVIAR